MDDCLVQSVINKYLNLLKTTSNFDDKMHLLVVINDMIKCKKLSNNAKTILRKSFDYECIMDPKLLHILKDFLPNRKTSNPKELLTILVKIYIDKNSKEAIIGVCIICNIFMQETWINDIDSMKTLLVYLTNMLATKQELESFEVCEQLSQIIPSLPSDKLHEYAIFEPWQTYLHKGLSNMILSKLTPNFLKKALRLVSVAADVLGIDWLLSQETGKNLFIAAVNFSCIEFRLCLENKPYTDVVENYVAVRTCYVIIEFASHYLIYGATLLSNEIVLQLNTLLKDVLDIIISFAKINFPIHFQSDLKSELFILLTIRCFAALITEENRCDNEDIVHILPFFIETVRHQFHYYNNEELTDSLMTGLCTLSFNKSPRNELLKLKIEKLLFHYIRHKWNASVCKEKINISMLEQKVDKIIVACNILLNIVAFESDRVASVKIYNHLQNFIMTKTCQIPKETEFVLLRGAFCTLGTAILQETCILCRENDETVFTFMQGVITFLWDAFDLNENNLIVTSAYVPLWENVIDFWLLTMSHLCGIIKHSKWIAQYCIDSEWPTTFIGYLMKVNKESIESDVKYCFEQVFINLYKFSDFSKSGTELTEMMFIARKQNMTNLLETIT